MLLLAHGVGASAQDAPDPGTSGSTIGVVREFTSDYVLLQQPGQAPSRYWFKSTATPTTNLAAAQSAVADAQSARSAIKVGDTIEIRWTYGAHYTIDDLKPAIIQPPAAEPATNAMPAPVATSTTQSIAASMPPDANAPTGTTGEKVNALIDNLIETGVRLLELPLFMLLGAAGILGGILALFIRRLARNRRHVRLVKRLLIAEAVLGLFLMTFIVDRKIALLQNDLNALRDRDNANAATLLETASKHQSGRQSFLFEQAEAIKSLKGPFGTASVQPIIYDAATDIVQVHINSPLTHVFLSVIDLANPAVEIKLGANLNTKTLTSDFAKQNNCTVAINGEAGVSPMPGSGLGEWRGNMMISGQPISKESPAIPRPFLSFDRQNHPTFTPAAATIRTIAPDAYNLIWGRVDALVNGQIQPTTMTDRQPRTAMGISQDGKRLYLMVVDGRQAGYSVGFTRTEVSQFLKAFGAYDAMLCDEGGSSCIYLKQFGGITNIPSDNMGQERPTYTHFGVALYGGS